MATLFFGDSATVNQPTGDGNWVLHGATLTIEAGASFPASGSITALQQSTLVMTGGNLGDRSAVTIAQMSTATFSGGSIPGPVTVVQQSKVTISGGQIGHAWLLAQESTITVQGSGLILDNSSASTWYVNGTLKDGTPLSLTLQVASNQNPHVVLENS
jgi:hypothetical protein